MIIMLAKQKVDNWLVYNPIYDILVVEVTYRGVIYNPL